MRPATPPPPRRSARRPRTRWGRAPRRTRPPAARTRSVGRGLWVHAGVEAELSSSRLVHQLAGWLAGCVAVPALASICHFTNTATTLHQQQQQQQQAHEVEEGKDRRRERQVILRQQPPPPKHLQRRHLPPAEEKSAGCVMRVPKHLDAVLVVLESCTSTKYDHMTLSVNGWCPQSGNIYSRTAKQPAQSRSSPGRPRWPGARRDCLPHLSPALHSRLLVILSSGQLGSEPCRWLLWQEQQSAQITLPTACESTQCY